MVFMNTRKLYRLDANNPRAESDHIALAGFFHAHLSRARQLGEACWCDASAATVAAHQQDTGSDTRVRLEADLRKRDEQPAGVAVGKGGDVDVDCSSPVAAGVGIVANEPAPIVHEDARLASPSLSAGDTTLSLQSFMLDGEDRAGVQVDVSSTATAGMVVPVSTPAETPACVRALTAARGVGPDTTPPSSDLRLFVASLVKNR